MYPNFKNNINNILKRMALEKKKTAFAFCLFSLMILMWVKVIAGKGPEDLMASELARAGESDPNNISTKIIFTELPIVEGRNDMLSRDFFAVDEQDFNINRAEILSELENQRATSGITQKIKLEAISLGRVPQAFINGRLLTVNDILKIADEEKEYEFEVTEIEQNWIVLKFGVTEIKLKLTQTSTGD